MHFQITLYVATSLLFAASASADTPQTYVQLIIKACPAAEQTGRDHRPDAVTGYYSDPINQGLVLLFGEERKHRKRASTSVNDPKRTSAAQALAAPGAEQYAPAALPPHSTKQSDRVW
jgi:hypothetical protein